MACLMKSVLITAEVEISVLGEEWAVWREPKCRDEVGEREAASDHG